MTAETVQANSYIDIQTGQPDSRLVEDAVAGLAKSGRHGEQATESLSVRTAMFLQACPRKRVSAQLVADAIGSTREQAAGVLVNFHKIRTDVERVDHGVYVYTPGKGPGLKPAEPKPRKPAAKSSITVNPAHVSTGVVVATPAEDGEMLTVLTGLHTADGRRVACGGDGVLYAVTVLA